MALSSSAVPLIPLPSYSEEHYPLHKLVRTDFQRLAVFVVGLSIQTLRVDPARLGRLGIAGAKEHEVRGEDLALVHLDNIAHTDLTLRNVFKHPLLPVQHLHWLRVHDSVGFVAIQIIANYAMKGNTMRNSW